MALRERLRRKKRAVHEQFVEGNRVTLLRDGTEAFPAMLAAIDRATQQILVEMYWFDSDQIGRRFAASLKEAHSRGVEVAVIYDALGSITSDGAMFDDLRAHGVQVVDFNPIAPWRQRFAPAILTRRDHRKMMLIDGCLGFTGGFNIADRWLPGKGSTELPWRDDVVQIEGPVVAKMIETFNETWSACAGSSLQRLASPVKIANQRVRVLGQAFFRNRLEITRAYRQRIDTASQRVWITNAYFIPDHVVIGTLRRAATRGVDVRVLVPKVSDVPLIGFASQARWETLLDAGVRIFEWHQNVLHAKSAVIDGYWSTLGSFNLDYISLFTNLELNVAVEDATFAETMERSFLRDLEQSHEVKALEFKQRHWTTKTMESVVYRLRKLL
ncbi:MAG TPA: phospholipase D-like domain-containing protein [Polyangiaceae bacterium]|nr:phospholipase D-like domain-containing protein [Polyangiaceae bacterium]